MYMKFFYYLSNCRPWSIKTHTGVIIKLCLGILSKYSHQANNVDVLTPKKTVRTIGAEVWKDQAYNKHLSHEKYSEKSS